MADLAGRHQRTGAATEAAVLDQLRSGRYVGGPTVEEAQRRLAAAFGWGYGVGVNSGTDALIYALLALDLPPASEVIVPAVTFFATAGAVLRAGLVPVVADVRADLPPFGPTAPADPCRHPRGDRRTSLRRKMPVERDRPADRGRQRTVRRR